MICTDCKRTIGRRRFNTEITVGFLHEARAADCECDPAPETQAEVTSGTDWRERAETVRPR